MKTLVTLREKAREIAHEVCDGRVGPEIEDSVIAGMRAALEQAFANMYARNGLTALDVIQELQAELD